MKTSSAIELVAKLEKAVMLGKRRGLDTAAWEKNLGLIRQAREVAGRTFELLNTRGWCLWKCRALNDEVIVVVRDELVTDYPGGYPVYFRYELEYLLEAEESTLTLIHEAKKLAGVIITDVIR